MCNKQVFTRFGSRLRTANKRSCSGRVSSLNASSRALSRSAISVHQDPARGPPLHPVRFTGCFITGTNPRADRRCPRSELCRSCDPVSCTSSRCTTRQPRIDSRYAPIQPEVPPKAVRHLSRELKVLPEPAPDARQPLTSASRSCCGSSRPTASAIPR